MDAEEIGARGDTQALVEENYILKNQYKSLGLSSALDVLHISRASFAERYGEVLGGETEARKVYDWAIERANQVAKRYHTGSHLEKIMSLSALNRGTPNVSVLDNRGLSVRQLGYYRRAEQEDAEVRKSVQRYDHRGQLQSAVDPRLSSSYLKEPTSIIPNHHQKSSLQGGVLQSENVDAGKRVVLSDSRGKALWSVDSRGTEREFEYDVLGREKAVHEKEKGKEKVCTERFLYGNRSNTERGQNAVGQLLAHYGSSGYQETTDYSVLGQLKKKQQYFLKADQEARWTADEEKNQQRLEEESYISENHSNALGETVNQIDALGNERKSVYDIAGQIAELSLKLKSGKEKILSNARKYSASGQLEEESLGNGIRMHYRYEGATQRLSEKEAKRILDNKSLQSLHYSYDPVGNILSIEDKAKAIEYFKNEKTESINHYVYDSFYQLIESQGLESSQAGRETPKLPQAIPLGTSDASRLVNYKRTYQYDVGGNLSRIKHHGTNPYTQKLEIDNHSNRGIEERESGPTLKESFDGNGNLLYLNVGQPLNWDSRNQLKEVIQFERESRSDKEEYVYNSQGSRVEKRRNYLAQTQIHTERVRYLPGLEIREHWQSNREGKNKRVKEQLYVIQAQAGEPIRLLQWEKGKPDEIENESIYYSLSDQIGSNQLELNEAGETISYESYYPYGGTAIWATKNQVEANYKYQRYSGKEKDATGLYYYGYRYYIPWLGRWVNADPSGIAEGLNLFQMVNNNPITFYDPDGQAKKSGAGKGQPTFKELYPETRVDVETGEPYRMIRQILGFKDPRYRMEVDVRVYEHDVEDQRVYLFKGAKPAKHLVALSHGSHVPTEMFRNNDYLDLSDVPEGMPHIYYLGPHDKILMARPSDYNRIYAAVSAEHGVSLMSRQAKQDYEVHGLSAITGANELKILRNYITTKKETYISLGSENSLYPTVHYLEGIAHVVEYSQQKKPHDFLTIRKERRGMLLDDGGLIGFAFQQGYTSISLLHCRNDSEDPSPATYMLEDARYLNPSEILAWDAIRPPLPRTAPPPL